MTRFANKVYVIHRRDKLRASKDHARSHHDPANPKIAFIWNSEIEEILGEKKVSAIRLKNTVNGETTEMPIDGVFVAIGHRPNTDLFKEYLETDEVGYLKVEGASSKTHIPGIFAAGDVHDPELTAKQLPLQAVAVERPLMLNGIWRAWVIKIGLS